ncbi:MAG: putative lipid II flippase FtsW [Gammaproteobacteria bacterium]|nr:putative lipid II flippase FtsW [Gammaproteobacteria bacterium]
MKMASVAHRIPASKQALPRMNGLLLTVSVLLTLGLLMMTSASVEIASSRYGDPFFHLKRQSVFAVLGCTAMLITLHLPMRFWRSISAYLLLLSFTLLTLVLIPGVGRVVNGSARWIDLGFFNLQPSELAKVFIVIYVAAYLERHADEVRGAFVGFVKPLLVVAGAVVLLHFEPDHGAMVILLATVFCLIFLAGAKISRFFPLLLLCVGGVTYIAVMKPYVLERFTSYWNPWAAENVFNGGYQLTQALIAFGRGEWFGVGLGNSIQKLYFLPEAHNDFVLAIIGEELGLLGVGFVIFLFVCLVYTGFSIGRQALSRGELFSAYVAFGVSLLFSGQALINIGVNIGLLPTKGLTLPFLSYGGASLIVCCYMAAILLRIQYENDNSSSLEQQGSGEW